MDVATIALLGPVAINGEAGALAPRDRVVLSALALSPTEISSVERLADALWGPAPPPSWPKVVPGCIHRLRRTLGPAAIETTPYGYRLAVDDEDIDARRFESLLRHGREQLARDDVDRAAYSFGEAVDLWRGAAYPDLDHWEPGRIEAARLAELRLEAQECRIDAGLRAGRHADMLAPAQAAVAQSPLREMRWGLLALAQYRCGHQGEALQTLRRARRMLVHELGLDPGPDLAALETAILRQDPVLSDGAQRADDGICPFLGLVGYDIEDADVYFGREWEVADCVSRLTERGVLAVVGPSGSGKTSLVRAGVGAALARDGCRPIVMTPGSHPMEAIAELDQVGVALIVDQFEEVFTHCADPVERQAFCAELAARATWCRVVIALRADHLGELAAHPDLARTVERGLYLLGPMGADALRTAITGPADRSGLLLEPGLVDLLVREVEGEPGALPLLSHALRQTWERRSGRTLTVAGYRATGGIRESVAHSAEGLYESLTVPQRELLRRLMLRLITTTADGEPIRTRVPRGQLVADPEREGMVDRLADARLVTTDHQTVQVAHECLARAWPRLAGWLDEDVDGQRILRHLTATADAWQDLGRPDSELYRGVRLAQVVDWRDATGPTLTSTESDFIEAGVGARDAEQQAARAQARQRVRVRRRNRLLAGALVAVLIVALVTGLLALRQQRQREAADLATGLAEATRVDDAARGAGTLSESLLLAVEANRIQDSPATRNQLVDAVSAHPALIRSLVAQDVVRALAVSPDGGTLLTGESDTGISVIRTDTLEQVAFSEINGWSIEYRPDGEQLLLAGKGSGGLGEGLNELTAAVSDSHLNNVHHLSGEGLLGYWQYAEDVAFSADGRHVAVYAEGGDGSAVSDTAYLVWEGPDPEGPAARVAAVPSLAIALSPGGDRLYVLTQQPMLAVIDTESGELLESVPVPPGIVPLPDDRPGEETFDVLADTLAISPDGTTLAIGEGRDVVLFDASTLTERTRLHGHTDRVLTVRFSPDGRSLAAGGADRSVLVWDPTSYRQTARLTGHGGPVLALVFAPDSATLYSGGEDKRVLVWDLDGRRRFITRLVAPTGPAGVGSIVPSPDGRAVAYTGQKDSAGKLEFLDATTGDLGPPLADPDAGQVAAWLSPGAATVLTAAGPNLRAWDRAGGRIRDDQWVAATEISAVAVAPDGAFVVVGDRAGDVQRVDPRSLTPAGPAVPLGRAISTLTPVPGSDRVVAFPDDRTWVEVDLATGTVLQRGDLGFEVRAAAMSPDGTRVAVGGLRGEVGLLDLGRNQWITPPRPVPPPYLLGVAFAGDGSFFTTSSFDGSVHVWDGSTGDSVLAVPVSDSPSVAVVAADERMVVATQDGAVYRIDPAFVDWIAAACAIAGSSLTPAEWSAVFGERPYHETCSGS